MHGLNDDDIPFAGGVSMHRKGGRTYLSVEASVQFWIDANGCRGTPVVSNSHDGAVQINTWNTCSDSSMMVLCKIHFSLYYYLTNIEKCFIHKPIFAKIFTKPYILLNN